MGYAIGRAPYMTGDGAVVRYARQIVECAEAGDDKPWPNDVAQAVARAYLAQAAEIERLTANTGKQFDAYCAEMARAEASEARTADLLKALEKSICPKNNIAIYQGTVAMCISAGNCSCGAAAAKETV